MHDIPTPEGVKRISVSLTPEVFDALDLLVERRGFPSRSQAVAEMIHQSVIEYYQSHGDEIMAGTITLFYDASHPNLLQTLAGIQREHIDEVISSQHVQLENNHTMEVLLVQGPAQTLRDITNELTTCKGVKTGRLTLSSTILPPIHPLPAS